jgi:hypothetical protein
MFAMADAGRVTSEPGRGIPDRGTNGRALIERISSAEPGKFGAD